MKRILPFLLIAAALVLTSSCGKSLSDGGSSANTTQDITAGNWVLIETSQAQHNMTDVAGGSLTGSPASVSMQANMAGQCFFFPTDFSGSQNGSCSVINDRDEATCVKDGGTWNPNGLWMSTTSSGRTLTIAGTVSNGTNVGGAYSVTGGGGSCDGDAGTVYGTLVPSLSGNWHGNLQEQPQNPPNDLSTLNTVRLDLSVTQADSPSANGSFALSGSATLGTPPECNVQPPKQPPAYCTPTPPAYPTNSPCFATGTIDSTLSSVQGNTVNLVIDTNAGDTVNVTAQLLNPDLATAQSVIAYQINSVGSCAGYSTNGIPFTLKKS